MFIHEMQRAIAEAPRDRLAALSGVIWKAYAGGAIGEGDAQALAEAVQARKSVPATQVARRRGGSRPRAPESLERRRRWTSSGWLPPQIAAMFTMAECAVLAVVAAEVVRHGRCTMTLGAIAGLAGVCRSTVKNAMREARAAGFITIEEWRLSAWRSAPNTVKIISREWAAWLRMRGRGQPNRAPNACYRGGVKLAPPTNTQSYRGKDFAQSNGQGNSERKPARSRPTAM